MSREYQAILFDTRSIQRFIFTGTRLKTNIGASYLVDQAFERVLLPVVRQVLGEEALDDTTWREVPSPDWTVQECAARVGYIGGGNALLLVRTDVSAEQVREIVRAFTKRLLVWAPGLRTGAAIGRLCLEADGSYAEGTGLSALVHALKEGQSTLFPAVVPPYFGITQACPVSGNTADAYDSSAHRFYSQEVAAKLRVATRTGRVEAPAEEELVRKLRVVLPTERHASFLDGFTFPKEFEHLGQAETENYIALVHVDGNNMGRQFMACDTLTKRKNLSRHVRQWTLEAFASLVSSVTEHFEAYDFLVCARDEEGRRYLPLRPIVLGGDDCTFVCAAKVAFPFTQKLMEEMAARGIKSCGGIAILKTAYPFFRGYEMAESLCGAAKARMRATDNDSCWLDFALLHGEQPVDFIFGHGMASFSVSAYQMARAAGSTALPCAPFGLKRASMICSRRFTGSSGCRRARRRNCAACLRAAGRSNSSSSRSCAISRRSRSSRDGCSCRISALGRRMSRRFSRRMRLAGR